MHALKSTLWTLAAVALGIWLATGHVFGKTPLEHGEHWWKQAGAPKRIDALKDNVGDALENAKDAVVKSDRPHEHHSSEDRDALNKLIAKRGSTK